MIENKFKILDGIFSISFLICSTLILLCGCNQEQDNSESKQLFSLIPSTKTNIDFENALENSTDLNILNYLYFYNGAGVAAGDFNNDGWIDLYFTANQTSDKLYINKGDFTFDDTTQRSGIENFFGWTTGVTTVDINNDGWLDIYVCKIGNYKQFKNDHNQLYVNQGIDENGVVTFKELSKEYNLDISTMSTQASFFDYDRDQDLDLFLLAHSVHPNRTYGRGSKRNNRDSLVGDRLYSNDGGNFVEQSEQAGIFQSNIGYGLGLGIGDLNDDGYPDIYVGNDFFENDYLYINNTDGTFKEVLNGITNPLGHTTHFSMGNDLGDLNNDGQIDIISMDMLPEDLATYKTSAQEYNYQIYKGYLRNGYAPQYMQNTLHFNRGEGNFSESAFQSGIAATEWSWSPLIADFDNDGWNDLHITNGIVGATNDMDFIKFISNDAIQNRINQGMTKEDLTLIEKLPSKKTKNYFYRNLQNGSFGNSTTQWSSLPESYSNGAVYADLDNDGDLDIVVNNVNEKAFILKNNSELLNDNNYLKVDFQGPTKNRLGIGTKIELFANKHHFIKENFVSRGYLSSVPPQLHFGLGDINKIDSLRVTWSDGNTQILKNINVNQKLKINYSESEKATDNRNKRENSLFEKSTLQLQFTHRENSTLDFNRDPLIPFSNSNEGPAVAVSDINNDGLQDLYITGAKGQASALFQQTQDGFKMVQENTFSGVSIHEDIDAQFADLNNDGFEDLIVVSGGNEFIKGKPLEPRLYWNRNGQFHFDEGAFNNQQMNASSVTVHDFNKDGFQDIFISADVTDLTYGKSPQQYIFQNLAGNSFQDVTDKVAPHLQNIGNVKDQIIADVNKDGFEDLVVIGHWMPVSIFLFNGVTYELASSNGLSKSNGWWNCIDAMDIDLDGDLDLVAGNWGLNSRLTATENTPITLYSYDFDSNGKVDPLVSYYFNNEETLFAPKEDLSKSLPYINKKYLNYSDYAEATIENILGKEKLRTAEKKKVYELGSCVFINDGTGYFTKQLLPYNAQLSSVHAILCHDFNKDGYLDLFLTGNNYEISTQLGRLDASKGELFINNQETGFISVPNTGFFIQGAGRSLDLITVKNKQLMIVGRNNDEPLLLNLVVPNDEENNN